MPRNSWMHRAGTMRSCSWCRRERLKCLLIAESTTVERQILLPIEGVDLRPTDRAWIELRSQCRALRFSPRIKDMRIFPLSRLRRQWKQFWLQRYLLEFLSFFRYVILLRVDKCLTVLIDYSQAVFEEKSPTVIRRPGSYYRAIFPTPTRHALKDTDVFSIR